MSDHMPYEDVKFPPRMPGVAEIARLTAALAAAQAAIEALTPPPEFEEGAAIGHAQAVADLRALRAEIAALRERAETAEAALVERKRAPVQGFAEGIPWKMHLRAYDAYSKRYRAQPAMIEGGCRGGFSVNELDMFIPGWREELSPIKQAEAERDAALARVAELEGREAWQPPESRAEGYRCLGWTEDGWVAMTWLQMGHEPARWFTDWYPERDDEPTAFAPLPAGLAALSQHEAKK